MKIRLLPFLFLLSLALPAFAQTQAKPDLLIAGTLATFAVEADGTAPIAFEWFKDGVKIADGATFTIQAIAPKDAGAYTVKASNAAGSTTSDPYFVGLANPPGKPLIKVNGKRPQDVTVTVQQGVKVLTAR